MAFLQPLISQKEEEKNCGDIDAGAILPALEVDGYGRTAFHYAAQRNQHDQLKALLDRGKAYGVNQQDHQGIIPLHYSASFNFTECTAILLAAKADPNITDCAAAGTPLSQAIIQGHLETVRLLIAAKADVNYRSMLKKVPLLSASFFGHFAKSSAIIDMLIESKATIDFTSVASPVKTAISVGSKKILEKLYNANPACITERDDFHYTPLHYAAAQRMASCCLFLLEKGALIDAKDKNECTALTLSIKKKWWDMAGLFLSLYFYYPEKYLNSMKARVELRTVIEMSFFEEKNNPSSNDEIIDLMDHLNRHPVNAYLKPCPKRLHKLKTIFSPQISIKKDVASRSPSCFHAKKKFFLFFCAPQEKIRFPRLSSDVVNIIAAYDMKPLDEHFTALNTSLYAVLESIARLF